MLDIGHLGAGLAGLLSFLSPCILPMVPFYLAYMGGLTISELRGQDAIPAGMQARLVVSAAAFALGVTSIFMLLGLGATALGKVFADYRQPLSYLAAAILFMLGLHVLGALRVPFLDRDSRYAPKAPRGSPLGAYVIGLAFGFGWTPCVGPALAAILLIASGSGDLWRGVSLLLIFGLGMTMPFVMIAAFARPFLTWASRHRRLLGHAEKATGLMLILFAVLIATGSVNRIGQWMIENFDWSATVI
ncbi:cytochrome c biogenesis protein CcdA [Paracoccus sp. M683]|uniref:cytochrome c biogenesis CcdA family protein n=1 Tax=Paracoccus sp. M683 TaxID=2594268 RepID=UPI001180C807|nr:cytochrome c biogenesis protein CcdA [Paracoccus sp. M683]TRW98297.1 cytochrome c biogenesis protein CcdA [Paracoccus sp. M683]